VALESFCCGSIAADVAAEKELNINLKWFLRHTFDFAE